MIEGTANAWAESLGIDAQAVRIRLVKSGVDVQPRVKISAREVFRAMSGDKEAAAARKMLAEAEKLEREERVALGKLCQWEAIEKFLNERLISPLIKAMDDAPADVDREWVEKVLKPVVRMKLEAPRLK